MKPAQFEDFQYMTWTEATAHSYNATTMWNGEPFDNLLSHFLLSFDVTLRELTATKWYATTVTIASIPNVFARE
jgi:hypothetical protein